MAERNSVFNPVEQRAYGAVFIAQGIAMLALGKYTPPLTYKVAVWGAKRASRRYPAKTPPQD